MNESENSAPDDTSSITGNPPPPPPEVGQICKDLGHGVIALTSVTDEVMLDRTRHCLIDLKDADPNEADGVDFVIGLGADGQWELNQVKIGSLSRRSSRAAVIAQLVSAHNRRGIDRSDNVLNIHCGGLTTGSNGGGDGILIAAPSGSGKTTLTAGLVERGFDYLSDERIRLHGDRMMDPYPKPFTLKRPSWDLFAHLRPDDVDGFDPDDAWAWYVPASVVRPNSIADRTRCDHVLRVQHRPGEPAELRPLTLGEATATVVLNSLDFDRGVAGNLLLAARLAWETTAHECFVDGLDEAADLVRSLDGVRPEARAGHEPALLQLHNAALDPDSDAGDGADATMETPSPDPVSPDPVSPDPVSPDPVSPDPVSPDPVSPDPVYPARMSRDRVSPDGASPQAADEAGPSDSGPDEEPAVIEITRDTAPLPQSGLCGVVVGEEAVLFEPTSRQLVVLNVAAGTLYELMDGETTIAEMAQEHGLELGALIAFVTDAAARGLLAGSHAEPEFTETQLLHRVERSADGNSPTGDDSESERHELGQEGAD